MDRSTLRGRRLPALAGIVLVSMLVAAPAAQSGTTNGNLPGGTAISVSVGTPAAGALIASPPGDVSLSGTASIGEGNALADTTLIYVVDTSGSTVPPLSGPGCGGNQNGDSSSNSVLDCEIAAARALNQQAIAAGSVDQVGAIFFNSGASTRDADPVAPGTQGLTGPAADANGNSAPDIEDTLRTATAGGNTNFEAAVQQACGLVQQSTNPNNIVVFLSDGVATTGGNAVDDLPCSPVSAVFETFAVGSGSSCTDTGGGRGSLTQIATATGGTCRTVTDVATLPDIVPELIGSKLTKLSLSVDGGTPTDITGTAAPALPQDGPAAVAYSTTVNGLAPGKHELCVTATGSDAGGEGSVTTCQPIVVADITLSPATATNELGTPGQTHTVIATVAAGADGGVSGVEVKFAIGSGPNAGETATALTDGSGQATFTYAATQGAAGLGTDAISGCFTDDQGTEACSQATSEWVDTTAPEVACRQTTNPSGGNIPRAGDNPLSGQNPDGFYVLTATDAVDSDPAITLADSGSPATFGPFDSGTKIKLTQAPGAQPEQKPGTGDVDWLIRIKGDGSLTATDASGNVSAPVACNVAPLPK